VQGACTVVITCGLLLLCRVFLQSSPSVVVGQINVNCGF
jgi:hypothetical protein